MLVIVIFAEPAPPLSRPSPTSFTTRAASSRSVMTTLPLYAATTGPTFTFTLPRKVVSLSTAVSSAPGRQVTTCRGSTR